MIKTLQSLIPFCLWFCDHCFSQNGENILSQIMVILNNVTLSLQYKFHVLFIGLHYRSYYRTLRGSLRGHKQLETVKQNEERQVSFNIKVIQERKQQAVQKRYSIWYSTLLNSLVFHHELKHSFVCFFCTIKFGRKMVGIHMWMLN